MAVLINEFEAVAETRSEARSEGASPRPPNRLKPSDLAGPLQMLALRAARIRAH